MSEKWVTTKDAFVLAMTLPLDGADDEAMKAKILAHAADGGKTYDHVVWAVGDAYDALHEDSLRWVRGSFYNCVDAEASTPQVGECFTRIDDDLGSDGARVCRIGRSRPRT